jgi:hypothetical protein
MLHSSSFQAGGSSARSKRSKSSVENPCSRPRDSEATPGRNSRQYAYLPASQPIQARYPEPHPTKSCRSTGAKRSKSSVENPCSRPRDSEATPGSSSSMACSASSSDEIRNRYLAEIRDNMHIYRPPNRSRRDTLNPIRPAIERVSKDCEGLSP